MLLIDCDVSPVLHKYDIGVVPPIVCILAEPPSEHKGVLELEAELLDVNLTNLQSIKVIYQGCAEGKYCYPKRIKSL